MKHIENEKSQIYLINNIIEFYPDKKILQRKDNKNSVLLYSPSNGCLLALIREWPGIVTQPDLIEAGWGEGQENVSQNTFYQTILTLRRSLKDIGLGKDFITTVRQKGVVIPSHYIIETIDDSHNEPTSYLSPPEIPEELVVSKWTDNLISYAIYLLLISMILIFSITFFIKHTYNNSYFSKYYKLQSLEECHIFIKNPMLDEGFYYKFFNRNKLKCEKKTWWYVSIASNSPRISVIRCANDMNKSGKNYCSTDFYYGNKYNEI